MQSKKARAFRGAWGVGWFSLTSFLNTFAHQTRANVLSWLSFATLLAWMFSMYWSNLFVGKIADNQFDFLQMRALWLGAEAMSLLIAMGLLKLWKAPGAGVSVFAGGMVFAGTVSVLFATEGFAWKPAIGIIATGLGSAILLLRIGVGFARQGPQLLLMNVTLALASASLLDVVVLLLPSEPRAMLVALLPAICIVLLVLADNRQDAEFSQETTLGGFWDLGKRKVLVRVIALPLVVGLAYGLMQRLTGSPPSFQSAGLDAVTIASFFASAMLIGLTALFFESARLTKLVCFVSIPIIGVAFVLLPLFASAREAALSVSIVGFNSFYFMVWALWAWPSNESVLARRFTLGLLVLVGAESLGSVLGSSIIEAIGASGETLAVVSLIVVYLLLMAAILSFDREDGLRSLKQSAMSSDIVLPKASLHNREVALDVLAKRFGLSARETEVFDLLARGRNRTYISKALFVSDNTTRTHMKNVYRKLSIHSHQELIDLIEKQSTVLFNETSQLH